MYHAGEILGFPALKQSAEMCSLGGISRGHLSESRFKESFEAKTMIVRDG